MPVHFRFWWPARLKQKWKMATLVCVVTSILSMTYIQTILLHDFASNRGGGVNISGNMIAIQVVPPRQGPATRRGISSKAGTTGAAKTIILNDEGKIPASPGEATRTKKRKSVMVVASAPLDKRHVTALWSELQCYTGSVDHVLIAAPDWSETIISSLLAEVRAKIPRFASKEVSISAEYFVNDRYDVGLWCDGLTSLKNGNNTLDKYDDVVLLNDSLFALREFNGVLERLQENDLQMTSLSFSSTDPGGIWLESVFRSFNKAGLAKFVNHACVPADHPRFCPELRNSSRDFKRCITEHFEIAIARLFPKGMIQGIYPSDVPKEMWKEHRPYATWVLHVPYWRDVLVDQLAFPAAKVTKRNMIRTMTDPLIEECTRLLNQTILESFAFSSGFRSIER